jgi:hypothetical protein
MPLLGPNACQESLLPTIQIVVGELKNVRVFFTLLTQHLESGGDENLPEPRFQTNNYLVLGNYKIMFLDGYLKN